MRVRIRRAFPSRSSFYSSGHRPQKTEKRFVDLRRSFHLYPVAGAFDEHFAAHVRYPLVHPAYPAASPEGDHGVLLAGDEERASFDFCSLELRRNLDVAVNVPVPIQRPAKAALLVLRNIVIEVF